MKLRGHHLYCVPFSKSSFSERGENYVRVEDKIKRVMRGESEEPVEVILGIDELCQACPLCQNDRCQSPEGDEDEIRKFDSIILKGLDVSVGTTLSVREWRKLFEQKSPLNFCQKCRFNVLCEIGSGNIF